MPRRIVLTTLGSYGDLHPYIAIALGLRARGHDAIMATSECYRRKVEALGLGFRPVRPDSDWTADPRAMRRFMETRMGTVTVVREKVLPVLRQTYDDIVAATADADLLVSHMPWASSLVADKTGIPWASTMIAPMGFFSAHDLPVIPLAPGLSKGLRGLPPTLLRILLRSGELVTRPWAKPYYRLRAELGLPRCRDWNALGDTHSSQLVLALFSELLAPRQPDWPPPTVQTGFPFYDQDGSDSLPEELESFLNAGPPPIVFTLGISAAMVADRFFEHSIIAAQRLGCRAVLMTGRNPENRLKSLPDGIAAFEYAPFSKLFPRAAAVVHPGGIGTTGLAMRAGRPTLVVPFAHDQLDNAARVTRLGIARTIPCKRYTPDRVTHSLRELLNNPEYLRKASVVAEQVQQEDGVNVACDALEEFLVRQGPREVAG